MTDIPRISREEFESTLPKAREELEEQMRENFEKELPETLKNYKELVHDGFEKEKLPELLEDGEKLFRERSSESVSSSEVAK